MIELDFQRVRARLHARALLVVLAAVLGVAAVWSEALRAQEVGPQPDTAEAVDPSALAEAALAPEPDAAGDPAGAVDAPATTEAAAQINILEMLFQGGWMMIPIGLMSLLVVTFGVERALALRRHKILPPELIGGLGRLTGQKGGLDPRSAYRLCQQFPSTAANVIKIMLLKIGRPHTEVEHAVSEANEREAAKLYTNVRWLGLAAGIAPLLGLLGTVQGMIMAFFTTANLPTGANKAEFLAKGIYVALVTTFAGLAIAIPAAFLAHLFEGRIQKLFRELDEMLLGLMPQLERYEGRMRVSKEQFDTAEPQPAQTAGDGNSSGDPARKQPAAAAPK